MTVSLKKHPTEARTYTHPETGTLLVVSDTKVDAWTSEDVWLAGAGPAWQTPTLKAARERLATDGPEAGDDTPAEGEPLRFTLTVEVTAKRNDRSTLARVMDLVSDAALRDKTVKVVEVVPS